MGHWVLTPPRALLESDTASGFPVPLCLYASLCTRGFSQPEGRNATGLSPFRFLEVQDARPSPSKLSDVNRGLPPCSYLSVLGRHSSCRLEPRMDSGLFW